MKFLVHTCWPLGVFFALALLVVPASAAPTTFGFDATITNVPVGVPFELPLSFSEGDSVTGRFTFEPGAADPTETRHEFPQTGDLVVVVDGVTLNSAAYSIQVFNDQGFADGPFLNADLIEVGCSRPTLSTTCNPEIINLGEGEPFRFRTLLRLLGSTDILSDASIPADVDVWNELDLERSLQVNFDNVGPGSLGFDAIVNNLWVVPEPTSVALSLLATFMVNLQVTITRS